MVKGRKELRTYAVEAETKRCKRFNNKPYRMFLMIKAEDRNKATAKFEEKYSELKVRHELPDEYTITNIRELYEI